MGCASRREINQFKQDTEYLKAKVDTLSAENQEFKSNVTQINALLSQLIQENRKQKADLMLEIDALKDQTQYIDTKLDDNIQQVTRYVTKSNPIIENHHDTTTVSEEKMIDENDSITITELTIQAENLYKNSYLDLTRGNYQLALEGFREYLSRFPKSELAVNAQYWLAECFYAQGMYHQAFDEFQQVILQYPQGTKVPAALLKMGYSANKMGNKNTARKYLQMVIQNYPKSEEAGLANIQLQTALTNE